ncbi:Magnesium transporter nipa2 [Bulinus truncatus]|nr:Magnesium transporter nipa2 [Bulinus truncatus]
MADLVNLSSTEVTDWKLPFHFTSTEISITLDHNLTSTTHNSSHNLTNVTTAAPAMSTSEKDLQDFMIGLGLAIGSSICTGTSFILKKLGLLRYANKKSQQAGQCGLGYLKEWMWWAGMILMTLGELANFAAYIFAPATLVTPLGALSVIVSAVLSDRVLKEKLNILGKVGCLLCVLGSTVMVIHSPKEQEVHSVTDLMLKMKEPAFIVYGSIILIVALVAIFYFSPRYGQTNVLVYITICSTLGCFTVLGCKGVGTAINATLSGNNEFTNWMTYFLLVVVAVCILVQLNYLNKALVTFNTAVVTPIDYVFFTSFVITGSAILFDEFHKMSPLSIVGDLCDFLSLLLGYFYSMLLKTAKTLLEKPVKSYTGIEELPER